MKWLISRLDFSFNKYAVILVVVSVLSTVIGLYCIPPLWATDLNVLDWVQMGIAAGGAVLAWHVSHDPAFPPVWQRFWRWSIWCWVLMIGRTVNWGRLFFDRSVPRWYFHVVLAILLVAMVVHYIHARAWGPTLAFLKDLRYPFWPIVIGILMFLASELVERDRLGLDLDWGTSNLLEELFELPVFLALVLTTAWMVDEVKRYLRADNGKHTP